MKMGGGTTGRGREISVKDTLKHVAWQRHTYMGQTKDNYINYISPFWEPPWDMGDSLYFPILGAPMGIFGHQVFLHPFGVGATVRAYEISAS